MTAVMGRFRKKIKEDRRIDGIKVLVNTSQSSEAIKRESELMGADGFLAKFAADDVAEKLRAMLPYGNKLPLAA